MEPLHRTPHRLAPVLSLAAGLVLGAGIGLPTAHWVAGYLTRTPALAAPSGSAAQTSPTAQPPPSTASSPAPATPVPTPTGSPTACAPLATGQQPLDPLHTPPSGYTTDAALDWIGCGAERLPPASGFTVGGPWLAALSYTCPTGTAAASTGATLTVSQTGALPGSSPEVIAEGRADSDDVTGGGPAGSAIDPGTYRLSVTGPTACLWHLAVYRG
jgi:hypothetical protein